MIEILCLPLSVELMRYDTKKSIIMLSQNERKFVEAIRNAKQIKIVVDNTHSITFDRDISKLCWDIKLAAQDYFIKHEYGNKDNKGL